MLAGVLYACGDKNSFEIKGTIDGAANKKMVVQRTDNGVWVNIDSIETMATASLPTMAPPRHSLKSTDWNTMADMPTSPSTVSTISS